MVETPSNILFIVWDACRLDYAREHASNLMSLAESNLWFENAIAPASWSPPSHASLFTGTYPDEHGIYQVNDSMNDVTIFDRLKKQGYTCYGVSGNGFVSHATNLHQHFDDLSYTAGQGPFLDGLTIYEHVFGNSNNGERFSKLGMTIDTVRAILTHKYPIKSLVNFAAVGTNRIATHVSPLQRLNHPIFNPFQPYSYSPTKNTQRIRSYLDEEMGTDTPFFIFANYMDTHRPYLPSKSYRKSIEGCPQYPELRRINNEVAEPWKFIERTASGEICDSDIEWIKKLYATELTVVDDHLRQILNELEQRGLRENTLIVVTADHGENLGELDRMGRRRMGHHASVSENLLRVPLVIAHPEINSQQSEELVSLKDLYYLFTGGYEQVIGTGADDISCLLPDNGTVECQYPATGGQELYDQYPEVPFDPLRERVEEDVSVAYRGDWKVVAKSTGEWWAWNRNNPVEIETVPNDLIELCNARLASMSDSDDKEVDLTQDEIDHLEALGYM